MEWSKPVESLDSIYTHPHHLHSAFQKLKSEIQLVIAHRLQPTAMATVEYMIAVSPFLGGRVCTLINWLIKGNMNVAHTLV